MNKNIYFKTRSHIHTRRDGERQAKLKKRKKDAL